MICPPLPEAITYLWRAFLRLHCRRACGFGPAPISWSDIDAFVRNSRTRLAPWEIEIIEQLDGLYLTQCSKDAKAG